jgi:hypothetical protein
MAQAERDIKRKLRIFKHAEESAAPPPIDPVAPAIRIVRLFINIRISFLGLRKITYNFPRFPPANVLKLTYNTQDGKINCQKIETKH